MQEGERRKRERESTLEAGVEASTRTAGEYPRRPSAQASRARWVMDARKSRSVDTRAQYAACYSFLSDWLVNYAPFGTTSPTSPCIITSRAAQRYAAQPVIRETLLSVRQQLEWEKRCRCCVDLTKREVLEEKINVVTHLMRAVRTRTRTCRDRLNEWLIQNVSPMTDEHDSPPSHLRVHKLANLLVQKVEFDKSQLGKEEEQHSVANMLLYRRAALARATELSKNIATWAYMDVTLRQTKGKCHLLDTLQTVELWWLVVENLDGASAAALLQTHRIQDEDVKSILLRRMPYIHIFVCPEMFPHDVAARTQSGGEWEAQVRTNRQLRIAVGFVEATSREAIREEKDVGCNLPQEYHLTDKDPAFDESETKLVYVNAASHNLDRGEAYMGMTNRALCGWDASSMVPDARLRLRSVDPARYFLQSPTLKFALVHADTREEVDPADADGCLFPSVGTVGRAPRLARPIFRYRNEYVRGDYGRVKCKTVRDVVVETDRAAKLHYAHDGYLKPGVNRWTQEDATLLQEVPPGAKWPVTATMASFWARDRTGRVPSGRFRVRVEMKGESANHHQVRLVSYSDPVHFVSNRRAGQRRKQVAQRGSSAR